MTPTPGQAMEQARNWIAERPEDRKQSAGAIVALLNAALAETAEPVAWGIFYFGGKRNGHLYSQIDTEENANRYIADLHQSNDTDTFRAAPLYTAPQPPAPAVECDCEELLTAAKNVMEWIEAAHRPPAKDEFETGRMVLVRLHALANLSAAIAAHEAKKGGAA